MIWAVDLRHDKTVPLSGSAIFAGDKIVVPISAIDVANAMRPNFECCKGHGAVAAGGRRHRQGAVDLAHHGDRQAAGPQETRQGVDLYGPSGAPIWSSPSVDLKKGVVYTATGENTSPPATGTSDSLVALDLATGKQKWVFQGAGQRRLEHVLPGGPPAPERRWSPTASSPTKAASCATMTSAAAR